MKDEGKPWLERSWHGGVQSPKRREQSKQQDHKPELRRADFSLLRDLLGGVPQDAVLERKGVQETQLNFKDQLLHSTIKQRQQGIEQGIQGHNVNTNPGALGWGQDTQSPPRAGSGREQERQQERLLQLHQWL